MGDNPSAVVWHEEWYADAYFVGYLACYDQQSIFHRVQSQSAGIIQVLVGYGVVIPVFHFRLMSVNDGGLFFDREHTLRVQNCIFSHLLVGAEAHSHDDGSCACDNDRGIGVHCFFLLIPI